MIEEAISQPLVDRLLLWAAEFTLKGPVDTAAPQCSVQPFRDVRLRDVFPRYMNSRFAPRI